MLLLTACSVIDEDILDGSEESSENVTATLAFTVSDAMAGSRTRMADAIVQSEGQSFRGIQDIRIIPFKRAGKIESGDMPTAFALNNETASATTTNRFYYYGGCYFMAGTASVLFYGRAVPTSENDYYYNGKLNADFPVDNAPANIKFSLEQMWKQVATSPTDGGTIATQISNIAKSSGWSTATESYLRAYYQNFIGAQNDGTYSVLAGSTASVRAYIYELEAKIKALSFEAGSAEATVRSAILTSIGTAKSALPANYPGSSHLPDGAAVIRWNATTNSFTPLTESTAIAPITSMTRFAYPPELYYFVNSRIRTSNSDVAETTYTNGTSWSTILSNYEYANATVSSRTKAVAITDPIQYAVARLKMTLNAWPASLQDAAGKTVTTDNTKFPMTGVIIGGQHQLGFDFKPTEDALNDRLIYDCQGIPESGIGTVNSLVLESRPYEKVNIVLEFENQSGASFVGENGIIYPGTKFYLIGEVDPADASGFDRVFIQDNTTEVTMTVASLAKAYNVLPDLLSPRLEIGVKVEWKWEATTPTNVPLS